MDVNIPAVSYTHLDVYKRQEEGPTDAFVKALNETVTDWLFRHIKGFDRSVAEYKNMRQNSENL